MARKAPDARLAKFAFASHSKKNSVFSPVFLFLSYSKKKGK